MKTNLFLLLLLLFLLPGCFNNQPQQVNQETQTLAIQAISTSPIITEVIAELTPIINNIIKKELALDLEYAFAFFLPKKLQRVTLYYVCLLYTSPSPRD